MIKRISSEVLFLCIFLKGRRDSDGGKKAKAYGAEEAGRQSGEKKTEYKGAGAGQRNARLSEAAASGGKGRVETALSEAFGDGSADGDRYEFSSGKGLLCRAGSVEYGRYHGVEQFINDLAEKYHIVEIAVDRWNATQMIQNLEGDGFTMVPFGQGFASMSGPTKDFYQLLMEGKIIHGGHPVLRWMAGNVVVDTDPAGNIKVTKARSKEKIDRIVAAIMALDRCIRNHTEPRESVYESRGLLILG